MISVAYFDQSIVFLYLVLGAIGSLWAALRSRAEDEAATSDVEVEEPHPEA